VLTPAQLEDLAQLHAIADRFKADIVIIGAAALLCFMNIGRFTRDIDLALALDLEAFTASPMNLGLLAGFRRRAESTAGAGRVARL